ncbi:hypothetical protein BG28_13655 [Nesterenkonia sp. AN1]|nr:hypothetical protein BG28_13655 [Nesterenkonia sp. AN1]
MHRDLPAQRRRGLGAEELGVAAQRAHRGLGLVHGLQAARTAAQRFEAQRARAGIEIHHDGVAEGVIALEPGEQRLLDPVAGGSGGVGGDGHEAASLMRAGDDPCHLTLLSQGPAVGLLSRAG